LSVYFDLSPRAIIALHIPHSVVCTRNKATDREFPVTQRYRRTHAPRSIKSMVALEWNIS
jgi:hypothetical protein